jgi:SAM-dependent methyltransferase
VLDPTKRFSNRVENYLKFRPGYPPEIIDLLERECGLTAVSVIADIGSGTGLLSQLFLKHGNRVFCVEPNAGMRTAGEKILAKYPNFVSVNASAENTTLPDHSIDFVVAGQAFHWFNREQARTEFLRVLTPGGWVVLIWNGFRVEKSPLVAGYQRIVLRYGTDYQEVRREVTTLNLESFFTLGSLKRVQFDYQQLFDFEGLRGRLLSASYAPEPDDPNFNSMIEDLRNLFDETQTDGKVTFDYDTEVYYGKL